MLVLSYPKKNSTLFLVTAILATCLLAFGTAHAQTPQAAVINPAGGTNLTDGLRITITDTAILVKKNGVDQYNLDPAYPQEDRGLKIYAILEQRFGSVIDKNPIYLKACEISSVNGDGSAANPWQVATLNTIQNPTGGVYNVTIVYTYINGNAYYLADFYITGHEGELTGTNTGGSYYLHFYFSEHTWMNGTDCGIGYEGQAVPITVANDPYLANLALPFPTTASQTVGVLRQNGICDNFNGAHLFKTNGGFTSYWAGAPLGRDAKLSPGYRLYTQVNALEQNMGIAVHKAVEIIGVPSGKVRTATKRFAIGFDKTEIENLTVADPPLPLNAYFTATLDLKPATIELTAATSSGLEGNNTHGLTGLSLKVHAGALPEAYFNAPQVAWLRVVTTGTGTGHAAPGTDYEVTYEKVIIPAGYYQPASGSPTLIPLDNILIKGDAFENPDKTMIVELLPMCSPYLQLGSITSSTYTIVDDDENKIHIEPQFTTLNEGQSMKIKIRMSGTPLATPLVVTLSKDGTSDAEDEDHSVIPSTITIPAGQFEAEFDFDAIGDRILEPLEEILNLHASAVFGAETRTHDTTFKIIDTTQNNPANKTIYFTAPDVKEGVTTTVTASLPAGVSTEEPIVISMPTYLEAASTADVSDFTSSPVFPADITIGVFSSSTTFTLDAAQDGSIEPDEEALFIATVPADPGFTVEPGRLVLKDNEANKQIIITLDQSAMYEAGIAFGSVKLPYAVSSPVDITIFKDAGTTVTDDDIIVTDYVVHFDPGFDEGYFYVEAVLDQWIEHDEDLVLNATFNDYVITPATLTISDMTSLIPGYCDVTIESATTTMQEGQTLTMKVKLPDGTFCVDPIEVVLTRGGGSSTGLIDVDDYTMPATVTINPGDNEATFTITAKTDNIIEPVEQLEISGYAMVFGNESFPFSMIDINDETGNDPDNKKISISSPLTVQEGNTLQVAFSLPAGITATEPIDIYLNITNAGAGYAEDGDFISGVPLLLTIQPGDNQVIWTAEPSVDGVFEPTEHLILQANVTDYVVNNNDPIDITVTDLTAGGPGTPIIFSTSQTDMTEGGTGITVTATLQSGTAPLPITITLDKLAGTTAEDDDFSVSPTTITIAAGSAATTFVISAETDLKLERREVLKLGGTATGYTIQDVTLNIDDATGTVANKQITLVPDAAAVTEGNIVKVWAELPAGIITTEDITVQLDRGAGTDAGLAASEYVLPATVVILAGDNKASFDLEAVTDNIIEQTEKLQITAEATVFDEPVSAAVDVNITDVTGTPANREISFTAPSNVTEGSNALITFKLPAGITASEDITISFAAGASTPAINAADFDPALPSSVTIPAGDNDVQLTISAKADGIIETTEALHLMLSATGYTFVNPNLIMNVIDNDMTAASITITGSSANITEGDPVTLTATLNGGLVTADAIVVTVTKGGSSTASTADHTALANITIPANASSGSVSFSASLDDLLEPSETVVVQGAAAGFTVLGTAVTIVDKNGQNLGNKVFSVDPEATTIAEGNSVKVWIRLPSPQKTQDALTISLASGSASSAGLQASEYSMPGSVTIPAGESEISFMVDALTDNLIENIEELEISASAMVYGTSITSTNKVDITDATSRLITVTVPASIIEGASGTITFSLPASVTATQDITISLTNGTSSAIAADFDAALPTGVTILAGAGSASVSIAAKADGVIEATENLQLIPSATGFTFSGNVATDIIDNDASGATIALTSSSATLSEGGSAATITATLLGGLTASSDITITLGKNGSSTAGNTDHAALTTITILSGSSSGTATISAVSDLIIEPNETIVLEGTASGFTVTGTTLNIADATSKLITVTSPAGITEGASGTVTFSLASGVTATQDITINLTNGTSSAIAADFDAALPTGVTILAGAGSASVSIAAKADGVIEATENLQLIPSATGFTFSGNVAADIIDNDASGATIALTSSSATLSEGGSAVTITATLLGGLTASSDITITLGKNGSSTAGNTDHTALTTITILSGSSSGTATISAVSDLIIEPNETIVLEGTASGFTVTGTTLNIADATSKLITVTSPAGITEGASGTVTFSLASGVTATQDITINITNGTSSAIAADFDAALPTSVTILAGAGSASVSIAAKADGVIEATENLQLIPSASGFTFSGNVATDIIDNDASGATIALTSSSATLSEGGSAATITATLLGGLTASSDITITLGKNGSSTAGNTDHAALTTITILSGSSSGTATISAVSDLIIEPNETIVLEGTASGFTVTGTTLNIADATSKLITVTSPAGITEGASGTVTFSLASGVTATQDIIITLTNGTSTTSTADFNMALPATVTIPAGAGNAQLTIDAKADGIIESTENLQLIPSATGFTFSGNVATDLIDETITGNITISTATVLEGNNAIITVSLPGSLIAGSDVVVNLDRGAASSAAATDHSTLPASVTIKAGDHNVTFTITAITDNILEPAEDLVIEGAATGYVVSAAAVQITDATSLNPANTLISLLPDASSIQEGSTAHFAVSLPAGIVSSTPVTVNIAKTAGGSTAADTDHTQVPASLIIPAMANKSADFNISAVTDMILEPQETLKVDGSVPAGFTFNGTVIYIDDITGLNPANKQITVTIDATVLNEGNTANVTFALPAGITTATAINIAATANTAFTANNADYTLPVVIIPAGGNSATVTLQVVNDGIQEGTEELGLSASAAGFTFMASGTVTIPGDAPPAITVQAIKTTDAAEQVANGTFTIQLTGGAIAPADITVNYTVSGTAVSGTDYNTLSGSAVILAGNNSVAVPVTIKTDNLVEGDETIQLTLQSASFLFLGTPATATVDNTAASMTVADEDYDRSILIEKLADATEPNTPGTVKVRFRANIIAAAPVTVTYTVTGTATPGVDYTSLPGTVTIPAGNQRVTIPITPVDDNIKEGTETVIVTMNSATSTIPGISWPLKAGEEQATVNITDNDLVTMEIFAPTQVAEGGIMHVKLRASQASPVDIPVTVTLQHDATRNVTPTVPQSGTTLTVTLPANAQEIDFDIQLNDNDTNDDDGFVNLLIEPQSSGQPYGKGSSSNTATMITDNDPLEVRFRKDTVRVMEGHTGTVPMIFTVELSRKSSRAITLNYTFGDAFEGAGAEMNKHRANAGEDYYALTTSIVIPPLQDAADIIIPAFGDVGAEADEYFSIRLKDAIVTSTQNAPLIGAASKAIGGIMNDDMAIDMEIRVHKALSPNNDGKNDVLIIENIEKYARNEIVIMNRWGGAIYKTSNYNNQSNNFKGRANAGGGAGNDLTDGSYFYMLNVWDNEGKLQRFTGYIVLKHSN